MESIRPLSRVGYWLATIFFLFPIITWVTSVWPLQLDRAQWRFGAVGGFSNAALTPLLGLFIGLATAVLANHNKTRRLIGGLCLLLGLASVVMMLSFVLDFLQTRATADPRLHKAIDVASSIALIRQAGVIVALGLMSVTGLRRPRPGKSGRSGENIVLIPVSNASQPE